jgi:hypothetical protein
MDKYLFAILGLTTFSVVIIMYIRISTRMKKGGEPGKKDMGNSDSESYDKVNSLENLRADDFTLLE